MGCFKLKKKVRLPPLLVSEETFAGAEAKSASKSMLRSPDLPRHKDICKKIPPAEFGNCQKRVENGAKKNFFCGD